MYSRPVYYSRPVATSSNKSTNCPLTNFRFDELPLHQHKFYNDGNWSLTVRCCLSTFCLHSFWALISNSSLQENLIATLLAKRAYKQLPNYRHSNTLTAHLTPVHFIQPHPAWHLQYAGQQWAGWWENKGIYKYVQSYTQDQWKGGDSAILLF